MSTITIIEIEFLLVLIGVPAGALLALLIDWFIYRKE